MKITDKFSNFETKKEISGNIYIFLSDKVKLNISWKKLDLNLSLNLCSWPRRLSA